MPRIRSKKINIKIRRQKTYKRLHKKTHKRLHKGGTDDKENQDPSNNISVYKAMLERTFQEKPPLSGVLKTECQNPDNCLAFGQYGDALKQYFNNFTDLTLIDNQGLKRIGAPSRNGFVIEVPFVKGGYKAYNALKCTASEGSDNLYYEYYVGKNFINKHVKKLPCFLETFGCYYFNHRDKWNELYNSAKNKSFEGIDLKNMVSPFVNAGQNDKELFEQSCEKSLFICLLIQHFDNVRTLGYEWNNNNDNIDPELYQLLYQVYYGLTQLGNTYTHYDLHEDNVLLYKPYQGKQYITMRYHRKGKIYEFNTEYICKIIDYGRNYIKLSNGVDTNDLLIGENGICKLDSCKPDCGQNYGYNIIQGLAYDQDIEFHYIFPNKPNMSHDLRLANSLIEDINYLTSYGTPENLAPKTDNKSNNIFQMIEFLEKKIQKPKHNVNKKYNANWKQAAIMEIYDDGRDYTYTSIP